MSPARTSPRALSAPTRAESPTTVPRLRPGTPILVQPGNSVRVGIDPTRSLLLDLDDSVSAHSVAALLRSLEDACTADTFSRRARRAGLHDDDLDLVLRSLVSAGRVVTDVDRGNPEFRILIHGQGPISDHLTSSLSGTGSSSARRTMRRLPDGSLDAVDTDLVVLTDFVVPDPRVVFALTRAGIPHLLVRVRDGVGIVGPLVLPGLSSCLMCADRHRSDADPGWPALAVQLIRTSGQASPAVLTMTAAVAHSQIDRLVTAVHGRRSGSDAASAPQLLDQVLELRDDPTRLDIKRWSPHPDCDCRPARDSRARSSIV
ncbi:hypothetical protein [Gordonia lacunae]|uniref:hypothetical protein n=1 Tax=Gordonia lacunae TaxID=417102 RepID=UPI001FCA2D58|nr:hypothetical protein [Gordonia lacunae]